MKYCINIALWRRLTLIRHCVFCYYPMTQSIQHKRLKQYKYTVNCLYKGPFRHFEYTILSYLCALIMNKMLLFFLNIFVYCYALEGKTYVVVYHLFTSTCFCILSYFCCCCNFLSFCFHYVCPFLHFVYWCVHFWFISYTLDTLWQMYVHHCILMHFYILEGSFVIFFSLYISIYFYVHIYLYPFHPL